MAAKYFARSEIRRVGGITIKVNQAIEDSLYSPEKLKRMLEAGIIQAVDSAPPKPAQPMSAEVSLTKHDKTEWPFKILPAHKAVSPKTIEGLDIDALNEQAVAAGWEGEPFTNIEAAAYYLSANYKAK